MIIFLLIFIKSTINLKKNNFKVPGSTREHSLRRQPELSDPGEFGGDESRPDLLVVPSKSRFFLLVLAIGCIL